MSRRQHVVRTDDQAGVGNPRSLGGCQVLCGDEGPGPTLWSGSIDPGDEVLIAPVAVSASRNFQRVFVSAAIGRIRTYVPDPIDPIDPTEVNTFTVTFTMPPVIPDSSYRWISDPFDLGLVGGHARMETLNHQATPYVSYAWQGARIATYSPTLDRYVNVVNVPSGSGQVDLHALGISENINYSQMYAFGSLCTVTMKTAAPVDGASWTISTGEAIPWDQP